MSAESLFFYLIGIFSGFIMRLCVEAITEERARRKGLSWPTVRGYEEHQNMYQKNGFHGIVTLSDGDTWDSLDEVECHIINQSQMDSVIESGGKAL